MIKIKSMCVALNLFCFGHFIPIPKISTPAKVIVAAVHGAGATTAKLEIMDSFAFDDISAFLASNCVSDNSRHSQSLFSAFLIFSISPLSSVRNRSRGIYIFSIILFTNSIAKSAYKHINKLHSTKLFFNINNRHAIFILMGSLSNQLSLN